jgi:hypothetical protein
VGGWIFRTFLSGPSDKVELDFAGCCCDRFFFLSFADGDGLAFLRVFGRTGGTRRAIVFVFGFGWAHTFLSGLYVISPRAADDEVFFMACGSTVI